MHKKLCSNCADVNRRVTAKGLCHRCYMRKRNTGHFKVFFNPRGSGGITPDGYKYIPVKGKRVFEHRRNMAQQLGRELLPTEVVHHIDGNKLNNKLENLQLFSTTAEHSLHHQKEKCNKFKRSNVSATAIE